MTSTATRWSDSLAEYVASVNLPLSDSEFLRENGLKPHLLELLGDTRDRDLLDLGSADGWVAGSADARTQIDIDLAPTPGSASKLFIAANAESLPLRSNSFDIVVASLSLMWMQNINAVFNEASRVLRLGGEFVAALVNPYFYRTGAATQTGSYCVDKDTSDRVTIDVMIAERSTPRPFYRRPFSDYLNLASRAGFRLEHMKDWHIDMVDFEATVDKERSSIRRSPKVPMYTFLKWQRDR